MELWSNEQVIWDTLGSTLTECWPTENMWKQEHWSARKVYQSWKLWLQRVSSWSCDQLTTDWYPTPSLPTVSKYGAQCHWLRTRPANHQGHTHWDQEVHARPATNANQTEGGAGQSILQCRRKSPRPTPRSRERHNGMQPGTEQILDGLSRGLCTTSMPADA